MHSGVLYQRASELSHCSCQLRFEIWLVVRQVLNAHGRQLDPWHAHNCINKEGGASNTQKQVC